MKNILLFVCLFCAVALTGCKMSKVTGQVTYPDGTPLTVGKVIFEKEGFSAEGNIDSKGNYVLSSYSKNDGAPKGSYKVYITGAMLAEAVTQETSQAGADGAYETMMLEMPIFTKAIGAKYELPETSGLSCEVKGRTVFNFTVEPALE